MAKNEFLRHDPKKSHRKLICDLTNLIIPVCILIIGIFLTTQKFAEMIGYNPRYCEYPIYVLKHRIGDYPAGYPVFNPVVILVTMFTNPFDSLVQEAIGQAAVPGTVCAVLSVFAWLSISIIRSKGFNKNDSLYGTARWGTKKDLRKFGLCEKYGVVLAQQYDAETEAVINRKGNFGLKLKRPSQLICHAGTSHSLVIAPTRSGKGVGTVVPTCCSYRESMIIFDPKGELYNMTAGYRQRFSRVIKFSPVQMETACFNPLEEVELDENAFRDIGTILTNIFLKGEKGGDSNSDFFDNNARDLLTGVIFHVLSAVDGADSGNNLEVCPIVAFIQPPLNPRDNITVILTAYPKSRYERFIKNAEKENRILYVNKKKTLRRDQARIQFAGLTTVSFMGSFYEQNIRQYKEKVNIKTRVNKSLYIKTVNTV